MTVEEYINNPSGGRVGGLEREAYKSTMNQRLDVVLVRENNNIKYHCYKTSNDGIFWLYMKVPSEVIKDFYYDVVLKFTKPKTAINMGNASMKRYQVQFFSNDPAFMYTHAYVYNKNGLYIKELEKKMPRVVFRTRPTETNLHEVITYCKSIYWAIVIANQKGLFEKGVYTETFDLKRLTDQIEDVDIHVQKRQEKDKEKKKKDNKTEQTKTSSRSGGHSKPVNFNKDSKINFGIGGVGKSKKSPSFSINFNKSKKV